MNVNYYNYIPASMVTITKNVDIFKSVDKYCQVLSDPLNYITHLSQSMADKPSFYIPVRNEIT